MITNRIEKCEANRSVVAKPPITNTWSLDTVSSIPMLTNILVISFISLLTCGFNPFPLDIESYSVVAESSVFRRVGDIFHIAFFGYAFIQFIEATKISAQRANIFPLHFLLFISILYGWASLSILWTYDQASTIHGILTQIVNIIALCLVIRRIDNFSDFIRITYSALILALLICLAGLALIPERAIHTVSDGVLLARDLDGLWRGWFMHKNYGAGVIALLAIISALRVFGPIRASGRDIAIFLSSCVFLYNASSATANIGAVVAILIGLFLVWSQARALAPIFLFFALSLPFLLPVLTVFYLYPEFGLDFESRSLIWSANFLLLEGNLLEGAGFRAVYTGASGISVYDNYGFISRIGTHSHNGMMEIAGQLGFIGAAIAFGLFIFGTKYTVKAVVSHSNNHDPLICPTIISLLVFTFIRASLEPDFMSNRFQWYFIVLIFLIAYRQLAKDRRGKKTNELG